MKYLQFYQQSSVSNAFFLQAHWQILIMTMHCHQRGYLTVVEKTVLFGRISYPGIAPKEHIVDSTHSIQCPDNKAMNTICGMLSLVLFFPLIKGEDGRKDTVWEDHKK